MAIDTLITDVHGQDYIVLRAADGIVYAPCSYDDQSDIAIYCPDESIMLATTKPMTPLAQHEREIRISSPSIAKFTSLWETH